MSQSVVVLDEGANRTAAAPALVEAGVREKTEAQRG